MTDDLGQLAPEDSALIRRLRQALAAAVRRRKDAERQLADLQSVVSDAHADSHRELHAKLDKLLAVLENNNHQEDNE